MSTSDDSLAASARAMLQLSELTSYNCFCAIRIVISDISIVLAATRVQLFTSEDQRQESMVHVTFDLSYSEGAGETSDIIMNAVKAYATNRHMYRHFIRAVRRSTVAESKTLDSSLKITVLVNSRPVHVIDIPFDATQIHHINEIVEAVSRDLQCLCQATMCISRCKRCADNCILSTLRIPSCIVSSYEMNENGFCDTCRKLCATKLTGWAKRCITDPRKAVCQRRLLREFKSLLEQ